VKDKMQFIRPWGKFQQLLMSILCAEIVEAFLAYLAATSCVIETIKIM